MIGRLQTFLFIVLFPLLGMAQNPHPILQSFEAIKQTNGILLKWVIKGGQQCQGTKAFHSKDGVEFELLNHIPGICGNFTEDETYTFFDSIPFKNTYNHYKLELGFQGFTDVIAVFFEDFGRANYIVLSSPDINKYQILFTNDLGNTTSVGVYDQLGNTVYHASNNRSDYVLSTNGWRHGIYIFKISGADTGSIFGKIYVSQ